MSGFKEPEEAVDIWCQVDETRIGVDARSRLTDACLAWLFVGDVDAVRSGDLLDVRRLYWDLSRQDLQLGATSLVVNRWARLCANTSDQGTDNGEQFQELHGEMWRFG